MVTNDDNATIADMLRKLQEIAEHEGVSAIILPVTATITLFIIRNTLESCVGNGTTLRTEQMQSMVELIDELRDISLNLNKSQLLQILKHI